MTPQPSTRSAAPDRPAGFALWTAELGVALVFVVAGALVVNGSLEQGVG